MAHTDTLRAAVVLCILPLFLALEALAENATGLRAGVSTSCDEAVKARKFNDDFFEVGLLIPDGFDVENIVCSFSAKDPGAGTNNQGRKGVKGNYTARTFNQFGNATGTFPGSLKTNSAGYANINFPHGIGTSGATVEVKVKGSRKMNQADLTCFASNVPPCDPNNTTLCLDGGRFQVKVDWRDFDNSTGPGMVLQSQNNQGSFYFFNPNNASLIVQLLDSCKNNDFFWVFANAATNVEYELTVTDTATGFSRVYENPLGRPAPAITDTSAFATCP